ncbi:L,D-transpeptidase [Acetivibrio cellulolyticus]|uniref:L,D-transpeptidase n=1 Tax=Acetivibrio cellulolyticus TaxID=35830 RepID=UPI0001E2DE45|nr:L,D-transpeptidase [Acetivibrio cellulolyticus]
MIKRPILRRIAYVLFGAGIVTIILAAFPGSFSAAKAFLNTNQYIAKVGGYFHTTTNKYNVDIDALKQEDPLKSDTKTAEAVQETPINQQRPLSDIINEKGIDIQTYGLEIYVDKSDHVLSLISNGKLLKSYHVELGDSDLGDKEISGDHKTPEGTFYISEKSILDPADEYLGSRWMRLSYPNIEDAERGLEDGIISSSIYEEIVTAFKNFQTTPQNTSLGGGVGIHGGSTAELGSDWTWGCVGLSNSSVEDFYDYVKVGTKVVIQK